MTFTCFHEATTVSKWIKLTLRGWPIFFSGITIVADSKIPALKRIALDPRQTTIVNDNLEELAEMESAVPEARYLAFRYGETFSPENKNRVGSIAELARLLGIKIGG